ncbi:BON domain-containing protein [Pseudomonas sp. M30-35]|uniref:BON domain-containing protein n=1 Tax=Pseudomonas sp. M30-35 TaxID=1981174 RepID=UPI000B3D09DE|nr:BON domain-containing protein [Pseudomonas sp. M30-35]ARU89701.1 phospholipid-binding protein [Pseudomonas sp. M30-35]
MIRSPLTIAALALTLLVSGCSNRSIGNSIDDKLLDPDVRSAVQKANPDLTSPTSHIVVSSYNGIVLLAGQTPREELKQTAEKAANSVQGVKKVYNELQILPPTSLIARSNDSLLTAQIKTEMLANSNVPSTNIKVITENGIVYLLGLVTRQEAQSATQVVQGVSGVQKVIKLFQYIN